MRRIHFKPVLFMRKFYSFLIALLAVCGMAQAQVLFDFANNNLSLPLSASGSEDDGNVTEISSEGVTITFDKGTATTASRVWNNGSAITLRVYKGSSFTVSCESKKITNITFDATSSNFALDATPATLTDKVWTGSENSVTFAPSKTNQIRSITVYLDGDTPEPGPDPIDWTSSAEAPLTVAAALERIAKLASGDESPTVYVKGKISQIDEINATYGNATYYISDNGQTETQLEVFRGKGLKGAVLSEGDIKEGDDVIVTGVLVNYNGTTPEFTSGSTIYSLNGKTGDDIVVPEYATIAALKEAATAARVDVVYTAKEVLVTFVNGSNVYVFDGTDGMLLYGSNSGIKAGDKITADVKGQLYLYNGLTEIAVTEYANLAVVSSDNEVAAQKVTVADVATNAKQFENELVTIEGLTTEATAWESCNVTFIDDSDNTIVVRDNFKTLTSVAFDTEKTYTVTGFVAIYATGETTTVQLYPRSAADIDNGDEPVPPVEPRETSLSNPYSVADVLAFTIAAKTDTIQKNAWVEGYIIGTVKSNKLALGAEDAAATNIAIAATADEQTVFLPVELPKGALRTALNLADNADLLGKKVWVCGTITQYFSMNGLKEVSDYSLDGTTTGVRAVNTDAADQVIYNLAGQRLQTINRGGLYIVSGKKVLVK